MCFVALAPQDYSSTLTSVVFSPGGPSQMCVSIPIMNDDIFETEEIFTVILDNLDGTTPTDPSTASIVIVDDDGKLQTVYSGTPLLWTPQK